MLPTVSGLKMEIPSKIWDSIPAYMTSHQNLSQTQPGRKRNLPLADNLNGPEYLEVRGLKIQVLCVKWNVPATKNVWSVAVTL